MSFSDPPSDAELVGRVLQADREAFAVVYDRYGTKLYDFAYSMLRGREDAEDAVADSFITFAERLPQLRDPDRLRPWLYAIVRSECLRRLKARKRVAYGDEEQLVEMADQSMTPEQAAERAALQKLVWDAAAGLADRDRALLDLHLRQGLEGAELGEAMGVSADNAYVMLNRLRAQVDRSLGALLIARLGRDECAELDKLLRDWNGSFSPLIRKRVARHVDNCDICGERRKKIISPLALLAAVPIFAAPAALRDRVVNDTRLVAYSSTPGDGGGGAGISAGPAPTSTVAPRKTRIRALAAAAVALLVVVGGAVLFWPSDDESPVFSPAADTPAAPSVTGAITLSPAPSSASPSSSPTPTESPSASSSASASESPSETPVAGTLVSSAGSIDLGGTATRASFDVTNTGELPLSYRVSPSAGWLDVSPASGELDGDEQSGLTVRADRSEVRAGRSTGTLKITWAGGSTTVQVSLTELNPVVGRPQATANPTCNQQTVQVRAGVSDASGLSRVTLSWTGPNGSGSARMQRSGSTWTAPMGPFTLGGDISMRVIATDRYGHTTTGPTGTASATPCPG